MAETLRAEHARSPHARSDVHAQQTVLSLLPISILTDSYKTTHFLQYPQSRKMVAVSRLKAWPGANETGQSDSGL